MMRFFADNDIELNKLGFRDFTRGLVDLMYPPTCVFCHGTIPGDRKGDAGNERVAGDLCAGCLSHIRGVAIRNGCRHCGIAVPRTGGVMQPSGDDSPICPTCTKAKIKLDRLIVLGEYREILREGVIACKRLSFSPLAANLGELLAAKIEQMGESVRFGAVTYIPSHWYRRIRRGGVPTRELARRVAGGLGVPLLPMLKSLRRTEKQGMLGDRQRRENVRDAFGVKTGYALKVPRILIVDDVWTTGSTLREATKQLRTGYDAEVWGAVVARAVGTHVSSAR